MGTPQLPWGLPGVAQPLVRMSRCNLPCPTLAQMPRRRYRQVTWLPSHRGVCPWGSQLSTFPLSPQTSLNKLLEALGKAEPFFIRCIRSNAEKVRGSHVSGAVKAKPRSGGSARGVPVGGGGAGSREGWSGESSRKQVSTQVSGTVNVCCSRLGVEGVSRRQQGQPGDQPRIETSSGTWRSVRRGTGRGCSSDISQRQSVQRMC